MPGEEYYEKKEYGAEGENDAGVSRAGFRDSDFIPLDDLVYAPLHALAKSNRQLRAQVVEAIKSMGVLRQNGTEETVCLNNINIAYDQVRPEGEEGRCSITARICSPEQRESDFLPRVSYKMQISSLPATEGILRLTDMLSANQIAKKTDTTPVAVDGNLGSSDQKDTWQQVSKMKAKIRKLKMLYQKITDMMAEQKRMQQISHDVFAEDTREFDKDKYLMAQSNIANRIMEYQEKIMNKEIEFGLEKDYE